MSGPDSGALGAVDVGPIPAVAAFEGADSAFMAVASLDGSPKRGPVFGGSSGLGWFAFARYHDRAHTQVVQVVLDAFLAVAAVGGDGGWCAPDSLGDPRHRRRRLRRVGRGCPYPRCDRARRHPRCR